MVYITPSFFKDDELNFIFKKLGISVPAKHEPVSGPACRSAECNEQSNAMRGNMDETADPCDDFYKYACGGWMKRPLPADHVDWDLFASLAEKMENRLRVLIEGQEGKTGECKNH